MGDLSRNHATLVRDGDGYVLQAHHAVVRQRQAGRRPAALRDGDVIRLGSTVELEFRQPSPVSATARLAIVSRHRLPLAVDGVLLMAETCIVGGSAQAHIPAPALERPGRPLPPGRRPLVPGLGRLRGRRPDLRGPRPLDLAVERPGRRLLVQPGTARVAAGLIDEDRAWPSRPARPSEESPIGELTSTTPDVEKSSRTTGLTERPRPRATWTKLTADADA